MKNDLIIQNISIIYLMTVPKTSESRSGSYTQTYRALSYQRRNVKPMESGVKLMGDVSFKTFIGEQRT